MDAMCSSLEVPPPAWSPAAAARRHGARREGAAWVLATGALMALVLAVAAGPGLGQSPATAVVVIALTGWGLLVARLVHRSRPRDGQDGSGIRRH
ncbi:hypothetical protein [Actinomyces howellii]|nr:hypothetical protein [Actinomyces howellii]